MHCEWNIISVVVVVDGVVVDVVVGIVVDVVVIGFAFHIDIWFGFSCLLSLYIFISISIFRH